MFDRIKDYIAGYIFGRTLGYEPLPKKTRRCTDNLIVTHLRELESLLREMPDSENLQALNHWYDRLENYAQELTWYAEEKREIGEREEQAREFHSGVAEILKNPHKNPTSNQNH